MLGVIRDPAFGPAISFGAGGTTVEVLNDRVIARNRISKLLGAHRQMPAVDLDALRSVLRKLSDLVCELPELLELDITPLIADETGLQAVDARIRFRHRPVGHALYSHMAIHPYPTQLIEHWQLPDGTDIVIRPIRPEDADMEKAFVESLSERSRCFRFMQAVYKRTPAMLVRFTQIDYDRANALIAVVSGEDGDRQIGMARYCIHPSQQGCEFALVVGDDWQGRGTWVRS